MLDKAEMYNFWSLYSRKIIGKRIERIIWLEVFAAYFVPNIRAEPCFKECFALCTLTLTVCLSSSVQQAISHDMFPSAPNSHPVRRRILVCHVYCRLEAEWSCNQALFWPFAFIAGCTLPSPVPLPSPCLPELMHQNRDLEIRCKRGRGRDGRDSQLFPLY